MLSQKMQCFSRDSSHRLQTERNVGHAHWMRLVIPQGELSPQSISAGLVSPLPYFHSAVKEAHNVVSQVDFQHGDGAIPLLPLGRVYSHWSIHTKVNSEGCRHEWKRKKKTACLNAYKTWQQKDRKEAWQWETELCIKEMSQPPS